MQQCQTCELWKQPRQPAVEIPGLGVCSYTPMYWNATDWSENGDRRILHPKYSGKLAFVQDGSDYLANLLTLPTFGCVAHKEKTCQTQQSATN